MPSKQFPSTAQGNTKNKLFYFEIQLSIIYKSTKGRQPISKFVTGKTIWKCHEFGLMFYFSS